MSRGFWWIYSFVLCAIGYGRMFERIIKNSGGVLEPVRPAYCRNGPLNWRTWLATQQDAAECLGLAGCARFSGPWPVTRGLVRHLPGRVRCLRAGNVDTNLCGNIDTGKHRAISIFVSVSGSVETARVIFLNDGRIQYGFQPGYRSLYRLRGVSSVL